MSLDQYSIFLDDMTLSTWSLAWYQVNKYNEIMLQLLESDVCDHFHCIQTDLCRHGLAKHLRVVLVEEKHFRKGNKTFVREQQDKPYHSDLRLLEANHDQVFQKARYFPPTMASI
jgi:hypothetical protein